MRPADRGLTRALPRWLVVAAPLLLGARVASGFYENAHPTVPTTLVAWVPLEKAAALSRERRLPILYDFSAEWCAPCQDLDYHVFSNKNAADSINARYIPVQIIDRMKEDGENPPEVEALVQKYAAGFPTLVIVSPEGQTIEKCHGYDGYTNTLRCLRLPTPSGRRPPPLTRPGERRRGVSVGAPARSAGTR